MTLTIGALNVQDPTNGYTNFRVLYGDAITGVPEVSGQRVLIPGREGMYTPPAPPTPVFESRRLLIGIKGLITGVGSDHSAIAASFATRFAALRTACAVDSRADVVIEDSGWEIAAGFLRFEHPVITFLDVEALELLIEFEATDPPEWTPSGS